MTTKRRSLVFKAAVLAAVAAAMTATACNSIENKTLSNTLLVVETLTGLDLGGKEANFTQSDVLFTDSATGTITVRDDVAKATLSARSLEANPTLGVSQFYDVQLEKYVVSYSRSDGKNTPGVDVPYSYEQSVSMLIGVGKMTTVTIFIVRASAKQEPPLSNLLLPTTRGEVLYTTARVDFYGHDLAGKTVKATGYLPVEFADFANN
jgi:hypothetical protein